MSIRDFFKRGLTKPVESELIAGPDLELQEAERFFETNPGEELPDTLISNLREKGYSVDVLPDGVSIKGKGQRLELRNESKELDPTQAKEITDSLGLPPEVKEALNYLEAHPGEKLPDSIRVPLTENGYSVSEGPGGIEITKTEKKTSLIEFE